MVGRGQNKETAVRKLINSTYVTLDGVIQDPQDWPSLGSFSERGDQIQTDLLLGCDLQIMGRRTYEAFAAAWPTRSGDPFSDRINTMPKYVFSSRVKDPTWENTTVIAGDPVKAIREIKEQDGRDIIHYGFGRLAHMLMAHGLLDELRLWLHPFFVGHGGADALIYSDGTHARLKLADSVTLESGIMILIYRAGEPAPGGGRGAA
jgi:dihydrofolate reductase